MTLTPVVITKTLSLTEDQRHVFQDELAQGVVMSPNFSSAIADLFDMPKAVVEEWFRKHWKNRECAQHRPHTLSEEMTHTAFLAVVQGLLCPAIHAEQLIRTANETVRTHTYEVVQQLIKTSMAKFVQNSILDQQMKDATLSPRDAETIALFAIFEKVVDVLS